MYKFDPELKRRQDQLASTIPGTPVAPVAPSAASMKKLGAMDISEAHQGSVLLFDAATLCPPAKKQKLVQGNSDNSLIDKLIATSSMLFVCLSVLVLSIFK